jgi:Leucine-rich repeat (LRR) protein
VNYNELTGPLPSAIGNLNNLKQLYGFENHLTGTLPTELGLLDKMEILIIGDNQFHGPIPLAVNNMLNLQIFSLHPGDKNAGKLTGPIPSFAFAPYLRKLYLGDNALTGSLPDDFLLHNQVTSTISVNLEHNLVTGTVPQSLQRFESLNLELVGNQIEELSDSFCSMRRWMSGLVEEYGCAAILCPRGFYNSLGQQTSDHDPCLLCSSEISPYMGATECGEAPPMAEPRILVELYIALEGSQWERNDGWSIIDDLLEQSNIDSMDMSQLNYCVFYGVICNNKGQIEFLTLSNNGLQGTIPSSVFELPGLVTLDVSYNYVDIDVEKGGFKALKSATKLTRLKFSNTNLASLDGIGQGVALTELFLGGSDFESTIPTELFDLTNLNVLHLGASFLKGPLPAGIKALSNLKRYEPTPNRLTRSFRLLIFVPLFRVGYTSMRTSSMVLSR